MPWTPLQHCKHIIWYDCALCLWSAGGDYLPNILNAWHRSNLRRFWVTRGTMLTPHNNEHATMFCVCVVNRVVATEPSIIWSMQHTSVWLCLSSFPSLWRNDVHLRGSDNATIGQHPSSLLSSWGAPPYLRNIYHPSILLRSSLPRHWRNHE